MNDNHPSTWADVTADAAAWVAAAIESGDLDPADPGQWIAETADGCAHVIYYANAWSLYMDTSAPQWEDEPEPSTDPLALLTAYAFDVVSQALAAALLDLEA